MKVVGGGAVAVAEDAAVVEVSVVDVGLSVVLPRCGVGLGELVSGEFDVGGDVGVDGVPDGLGEDGTPEEGMPVLDWLVDGLPMAGWPADGMPVEGWPVVVAPWVGELVFSVPVFGSWAGRSRGRVGALVGASVWGGRSRPGSWLGDGVFWLPWSGRSSGVVPGVDEVGWFGRSRELGGWVGLPELPWDWVPLGLAELSGGRFGEFGDCAPVPESSCGLFGEFEGCVPVPELSCGVFGEFGGWVPVPELS
ncbi:hypothetical protein [Nocardia cyriacigeorgica]|uniref:Uncharacterized protein n=1 Tax=Nocardia cyriacigeorgica TaxID=135487 RepID=A0A5R8NRA0_9NOCA|nr:hypothetical protein [Nocardia cyriacigeorgica]TLF78206.1 hypothetical protein FEK34_09920 [Nocardia cyriacigeorgica]